ncbi:MAG: O-antigen ligase family protein [Clostridiales bacterium]|nr:O-antigen ligase family protein [Clostridiales bacterium]
MALYIPFGILTIILIFSGKRNGSIAIIFALFIYFIVEYKVGNKARQFSKILKNLLLVSFIVVAVYLYLSSHYSINLIERLMSLPEDGGSSRDVIYSSVWFAIKNSTMFEWLFGHGTRGIITVFGRNTGAHNDFLEIFYNFGFFSVVIFIVFYIVLISTAFKMIKDKYYGASAFAASIVISLFMSMFSNYVITFTHITSTACFWGIVLADWISIKQNRDIPHLSKGSGIL